MNLKDYLSRIHYTGQVEPTKQVLFELHRAHLTSIAYENLDIHLGVPITVNMKQIFDKIVNGGRGGWCFEMNGLFGWALNEIGFDVTMYAATVGRDTRKNSREGDHLVLRVDLDQAYLADVGFGIGFYEPLPLADGYYRQGFLEVGLAFENNQWHFDNDPKTQPGYDFPLNKRLFGDFSAASDWLQTSPDSGFVKTTVCHLVQKKKLLTLRGAVLKTFRPFGVTSHVIESQEEYDNILQNDFGLPIDNSEILWPKVQSMHLAWLCENPSALR